MPQLRSAKKRPIERTCTVNRFIGSTVAEFNNYSHVQRHFLLSANQSFNPIILVKIVIESSSAMALNIAKIRQEFPILSSGEVIYLDSAATAQMPLSVLDAMDFFYKE